MSLVVFGAGYVGARAVELARAKGEQVLAVVRSEQSARALRARGIDASCESLQTLALQQVHADTHVVICFPPDGHSDALLAPMLANAASITYLSSTAVYGDTEGVLDDRTPAQSGSERVNAESLYRSFGATVIRAPGIYGPDRGLHVRVVQGLHKLPGGGHNYVSRIHVDDLAQLLLAARSTRGQTFVVSDLTPATQHEVCAWIASEYACPMPRSVPADEVHETLRRNRQIDPRRALQMLGVRLLYPSYKDGMRRSATD